MPDCQSYVCCTPIKYQQIVCFSPGPNNKLMSLSFLVFISFRISSSYIVLLSNLYPLDTYRFCWIHWWSAIDLMVLLADSLIVSWLLTHPERNRDQPYRCIRLCPTSNRFFLLVSYTFQSRKKGDKRFVYMVDRQTRCIYTVGNQWSPLYV